METLNILIAGVGGQGTLLACRVLGNYAVSCGYDCKLSEVHGMAQRGGSVVTHVRMGEKVYSPIISEGKADVLLAFERIEAGRYSHFVKGDGIIIVNTQTIMPMSVVSGDTLYPFDILNTMREKGYNVTETDASYLAEKAGSARAANIVLIGCLAKMLGMDKEKIKQAVADSVPPKTLEVNLKALEEGWAVK